MDKVDEAQAHVDRAQGAYEKAMGAVRDWWEQPGGYSVPWHVVDDRNASEWLAMVKALNAELNQVQGAP